MGGRRRGAVLISSLLVVRLASAHADVLPASSGVSFNGFGTIGFVHNSTDGAEFIRNILQPHGVAGGWSGNVDSRFGLQLNVRSRAGFNGVVQAVSSYNDDGNYSPELTWAFVGYTPNPGVTLRVGRLGWDVYLLSDSRNIGYSFLWVRPPVDYFGQLQISHVDGADVVVKHELGEGVASAKFYAGYAHQKVPSPLTGEDYDLSGQVWGANLDYQRGDWHFRTGYTSLKPRNELSAYVPMLAALRSSGIARAATLASELALADKTLEIASVSAVYEHGPWQSQLTFNRLDTNTLSYPRKDSGYFLLGYRIGQWTPFVTVSATRSRSSQWISGLPTPNPLETAISTSLVSAQSRQDTLSVGVRYDFARDADIKLQLDRIRVDDNAAFLWRNVQPGWDGRATVFTATLDFVF